MLASRPRRCVGTEDGREAIIFPSPLGTSRISEGREFLRLPGGQRRTLTVACPPMRDAKELAGWRRTGWTTWLAWAPVTSGIPLRSRTRDPHLPWAAPPSPTGKGRTDTLEARKPSSYKEPYRVQDPQDQAEKWHQPGKQESMCCLQEASPCSVAAWCPQWIERVCSAGG